MSKDLFTDKEIKILSNNKHVKSVSMNGITFTDEFRLVFITEYEKGTIPSKIFQECGFDISIVGLKRIKAASHRWRTKYNNSGIDGLRDTRKGNSGRSITRELSLEEKYDRMQAKIKLLEAENELLKKLDLEERRLRRKILNYQPNKNTKLSKRL